MSDRISPASLETLPTIKFYKDAVTDILSGQKTLDPRPRSLSWIRRAGHAALTYGPRFGKSTVFAVARITDITLRPFETADSRDLARIGSKWQEGTPEAFAHEYTRWFAKELAKGYPVAWISFEIAER
jgi:hypothetical protein